MTDRTSTSPMYNLIQRLFAEAPKLTNPDGSPDPSQAPAVICHVALRTNPQTIYGSLSETPEGLLRMLTNATVQGEGGRTRPAVFESFFDYADVLSVMVEREIQPAERSSLIIA